MITANALIATEARVAPTAVLGEGTLVVGNVEVRSGVRVGHHGVIEGTLERPTVVGEDCVIEDFARIGPGVLLGAGSRIGAGVILGHPSKEELTGWDVSRHAVQVRDLLVPEAVTEIGANSVVRSHTVVYSHVRIGARFNTGHGALIREHTAIADRVVFGTYASTDGYCRIGSNTQIGQYCQLSQAARIGRGSFIGGHTVFSDNDSILRDVAADLKGAVVEDYVRIGLSCVLLPGVVIGRGALVGAGSLISKDVPAGTLAYGSPARHARALANEEVDRYIASVEGDGAHDGANGHVQGNGVV